MFTASLFHTISSQLRNSFFMALALISWSNISAQDRIVMKNGNTLEAKVFEIQLTEIKYKRFDNLTGPLYSLLKSDVFLIMYENGTKEVINELAPTPAPAAQPVKAAAVPQPARVVAAQPASPVQNDVEANDNLIFAGVSLPLEDDGTKMGFTLGYELNRPFSNNFGLVSHFSLARNTWEYEDYYDHLEDTEFNLRVMIGPQFRTAGGGSVGFYGAALIGSDFQMFTSDSEIEIGFAYGAGIGLVFAEKFDLGIRFIQHTTDYAIPFLHVSAGMRF